MPWRVCPIDVVFSKPISYTLHVTKDHPVESCNVYRSDLTKSGVLSDNFCRCLPYWGTVVMFRHPGEDYTAHGPHYAATASHNAYRSYAVSITLPILMCEINSAFLPLQQIRYSSLDFDTAHQIHNLFTINKQFYLRLISNTQSVFRQVHSHFQSNFSTGCNLVLLLSNCSILYFFKVTQQLITSSSSSSHHLHSSPYLPYNNVLQKAVRVPDVTNPVSLPSICCTQDALFSLTRCHIS